MLIDSIEVIIRNTSEVEIMAKAAASLGGIYNVLCVIASSLIIISWQILTAKKGDK